MDLMSGLNEIFTTLVNECRENGETFKAVHLKREGKEDMDFLINEKSSIETLSKKILAEVPSHESSLIVKRYGTTQVILKIV